MLAKLKNTSPVIERVRLKELFADVYRTLPASGAAVRFNAGRAVWQTDATLLFMLLVNIVKNAADACTDGCRITLTADDKKIVLTDNGCGMSAETLAHMTEPFYRADKSRSRQGGGAGLGLSICQSICDGLGYDMKIESGEGKGTTVTVLQLGNESDTNC